MKINDHNGLQYISFENIESTGFVNHAFSTSIGGVSKAQYTSLNLGLNTGDNPECVKENYRRMAEAVGFSCENIVRANQTHGVGVHVATAGDRGDGFLKQSSIENVDALITNQENVVLQTLNADCVPVFLVDPVTRCIGLAHAGWRGTLHEIAGETVKRMKAEFGANPANMVAAIGPSIGPYAFEVDNGLGEEFCEKFSKYPVRRVQRGMDSSLVDLWGLNHDTLVQAGLYPENIQIAAMCTYFEISMFYSHRRMKKLRGSMAAFIEIKSGLSH